MIRAALIDRCRSLNRLSFHLFKLWFANCPRRASTFSREKWSRNGGGHANIAERYAVRVRLQSDKTGMWINAESLTTVGIDVVKPGGFGAVKTYHVVLTNNFNLQFVPCACD